MTQNNLAQKTFTVFNEVKLKMWYRTDTNDLDILDDCLEKDIYGFLQHGTKVKKKIALDVGAHIGGATVFLACLGYRVIAIEPVQENVDLLKMNVLANGFEKNVKIHQKAIHSSSNKQVVLELPNIKNDLVNKFRFIGKTVNLSDWRSIIQWSNPEEKMVETISLQEAISEHSKIDIAKFDCEGAEWLIFETQNEEVLRKMRLLKIEVHNETETDGFANLISNSFVKEKSSVSVQTFVGSKE
jgi:FkbM family methyltransferase